MKRLKALVSAAAIAVLVICVYSFLLGNGVFEGSFDNEAMAWYFLAKGIFCSFSMYLLVRILEALQ
ncbi:hypothetical protein ACFL42_01355 [Candidatus Omnitrophota bacterium]